MIQATQRLSLGAIAAAVATVSALGCSAGGEALPPQRASARGSQPAVPVTTGTILQKSMPVNFSGIGTAEAYSTVAVHAQITGELTAVNSKDGDDVVKGQVLFTLDRRPLEAVLRQAEANLARDLAQAANAKAQLQRYRDLLERGIATREQVDQSNTNATALEATVAADGAAVENAKVQLSYATIAAPLSGRTGKLMVHAGNLVRANDATPLVVINQVAPIYVSFAIPEAQLPDFKQYMARGSLQIEARPPSDVRPASTGRISFMDNAVDQTTGTITLRGTFPNEARGLWPGQFVNVVVTLTQDRNAIVVPSAAVQTGQQGLYVFVVKADKTVEQRPIQIARTAGPETVIRAGLNPGETVVTEGQLRLVPGSRVSVKTQDSEKAS